MKRHRAEEEAATQGRRRRERSLWSSSTRANAIRASPSKAGMERSPTSTTSPRQAAYRSHRRPGRSRRATCVLPRQLARELPASGHHRQPAPASRKSSKPASPRIQPSHPEISGQVELRSDKPRGKMTIIIKNETGMEKEHHVPQDKEPACSRRRLCRDAGDPPRSRADHFRTDILLHQGRGVLTNTCSDRSSGRTFIAHRACQDQLH